jgi:HAD superfamily hydrolase (TIGR01509 family)
VQAVIFDFDGVIVDSERHWNGRMDAWGMELFPNRWREGDNERLLVGLNVFDSHKLLVERFDLTMSREEFLARIETITDVIYGEKAALLPGVEDLLKSLHGKLLIGLASSSRRAWIMRGLTRLKVDHFFETILTGDDIVDGEGKPAPTLYLKAAAALGVDPTACAAIEDSNKGVTAAKAAGMYCYGLRNGFNEAQNLSHADRIVEGFSQIDAADLMRGSPAR